MSRKAARCGPTFPEERTRGHAGGAKNLRHMDFRIGHGYDVHALEEGLHLVLGGVEIPHTKGCVAHSDGDVAIHAVCDALLGAAALGDIGLHFPDTSADFKGIDSKILLRRVAELLRREGYEIGPRVGQGDDDRTARVRRPGGGRVGLGRGADLPGITARRKTDGPLPAA